MITALVFAVALLIVACAGLLALAPNHLGAQSASPDAVGTKRRSSHRD